MTDNNSDQNISNPIVLFDGVCNLCNTSVRFLLAYNRKENLHFASLQSEFARKLLASQSNSKLELNTVVLFEDNKYYTESTAAFQISKHLIYPWKAMHYFKYIPKSITDWCYRLIAKNRYSLFGKRNECMIPKKEWRHRFFE